MKKFSIYALRGLLAVLLIIGVIMAGVIWRLSSGPLEIGFAKPYIEEALRDPGSGSYAKAERIVLHWPELRGPLLLGLEQGKFFSGTGALIFSVDEAAFSLDKARLLIGDVIPEELILRGPKLLVRRGADNRFSVGLDDESAQTQPDEGENILGSLMESGGLSGLLAFQIDDAQVLVDDAVLGQSWLLPRLDVRLRNDVKGLFARYEIDLPRAQSQPSSVAPQIAGEVLLDLEAGQTIVKGSLVDFDPKLLAEKIPEAVVFADQDMVISADVQAFLNADFALESIDIKASSAGGALNVPDISAEPLAYQDLALNVFYNPLSKDLSIQTAEITLRDVTFSASGSFYADSALLMGEGHVAIPEMSQETFAVLWPASLQDEPAREWLVDKLLAGVFRDLSSDFHISVSKGEDGAAVVNTAKLRADFAFEGLDVKYKTTLAPVTGAKGSGSFDLDSELLRIDIEEGKLLDLDVTEAQLEFYNIIEKGAGTADLNIKLAGPLRSALRYVADEPIGVTPDFDVAGSRGRIDLQANLAFPTTPDLRAEDVEIEIDGQLRDVLLPDVLRDFDLSGGPYDLSVEGNRFRINGQGALDGRSITLDYREFLKSAGLAYSSKITASIMADEELRMRMGIDLSNFLSGPVPVQVDYTKQQSGAAQADIIADLEPARFFLDVLDYNKAPGVQGRATLTAHLQGDSLKEITGLKGSAPRFSLAPSTLEFREKSALSGGAFGQFSVHETTGTAAFEIAPGGLAKIKMQGAFLDLRPFTDGGPEEGEVYDAPPMQVSASADTMRTGDDETVRFAKIYADIDGAGKFNQLELDAKAGTGDIYMRYKPDESGKRVFRFEADDAGAALKAFQVYDKIRGGKLVIYGEPARGIYDRNFVGGAEITDFAIVNAPTLARIISALSLSGVEKLAQGGTGLQFERLQSDFDWLFRPEGSLLVLKNGRTSGNSLGLTFEGTFDNAKNAIDVSGTIVPLSEINNVIGKIPLVGDILTGGSGGIFAATYTIKGEGKEPDVTVNPLSVLAPGILRRILFEKG